jgi:monoamine oxidase
MSTIIIGAGAAGITAGYTLLQEGFNDFIILEAASTYLGRIRKLDNLTNFPIDIGAEWIHTNPSILSTIVNDANEVVDVDTTPYKAKYFEWDGTQMNAASLPSGDFKFVNYTWYDFFNDYLVPDVLTKIEFDCMVTKVEWTNSTTNVTCDNGQLYSGKKVIVTVPLKILQDEYITFVPELPSDFVTALNTPVMASGIKVFLRFKEKFYPEAFSIDADFVDIEIDESERFFYDETYGQNTSDHVLGMFALGDVAARFVSLSDYDVIQAAISDLNAVFGNSVATSNFINGVVQNWDDEPFVRGGYSVYEDKYAAIDVLRKPLSNSLYFAGEAIPIVESDYGNGYAHGAALSGRRAALNTLNTTTSGSRPSRRFWHAFVAIFAAFVNFITMFFT